MDNTQPPEPRFAKSKSRAAASRLRKVALSRGNQQRQQVEANAPRWKNEPPGGGPIKPHPGSFGARGK